MPSNHPILFYFLLLPWIFPSIRVFSIELALCISISLSNEYLGLASIRIDWLDLLAVQGSCPAPQFASISFLALSLFMVQLSHPYTTSGKNIGLTIWTFVGKVICLLFNKLSRFVIAFLPRSQCLLILGNMKPQINQEEMSNTYLAH